MKIAFLVLVHKNTEQLIRLIRALDGPDSSFFIHIDRRASSSDFSRITNWAAGRSNVHFTERKSCRWGQFGIVAASLACVRTALRVDGGNFDYGVLLSGQDYPLKPLSHFQRFLEEHAGSQFIDNFRLDLPNAWTTQDGAYQAMNRLSWFTFAIRSQMLHIPANRSLPLGLLAFGGSTWWCLSRECLANVDQFVRENPDVARYFKRAFIPDESFFQTIVLNSAFNRNTVSDNLHFIDWDRPNPKVPRTFEASDLERLRISGKFFARKFDPSHDAQILDLIDEKLLMIS
jgi:hypothetical protein